MALSANTIISRKDGVMQSYPVADNVHIYRGALVCVNTSGYALPGADTAGYKFVGVAWDECDNTLTGHAAGGKNVLVDNGRFLMTATSITQAMVGSRMYVVDDATIDDIAGVSNCIEVGILDEYVSATSGWVNTFERGLASAIKSISSGVLDHASFTDNTGTATGYIDITPQLPAGAIPVGWKAVVTEGFAGDTTAVIQVGIAGDVDRFSADTTGSVLATGTVGSKVIAADGCKSIAAATTVRVTVTGGADWGSITAGKVAVELFYVQS